MSSSCNLKKFCYCFSLAWSFHTPIGYQQPGSHDLQVPKHQHSQTQTRISTITLSDLSQIMEKKSPWWFTVCHDLNPLTMKYSHPRATVTSKPWRFGVSSIEQLHVVIATVCLLLNFKGLKDELYAIAFFCWDHPLTVRTPWVVVVPKLCMWKQVLGFDFSLQVTSTLWKEKMNIWWANWVISSSCCAWNKKHKRALY